MVIPLFLVLVALQPPQTEQQLQRQESQLNRIQQQLNQQEQQMGRILDVLAGQAPKHVCSAELRSVTGTDRRTVPSSAAAAVPVNLFSVVSKPLEACLPAEIRVTASYLDAGENLVCSGVIENLARQHALTDSINLEIRPWNLSEFARWRNEPPQVNSGARRLVCVDPDGLVEATAEELARVVGVRVRVTVFPAGGGMSTSELYLSLQP